MIITIDGPSGVGKGTLAKSLAEKLNFAYLDTGSLYRATTLKMLQDFSKFSEENAISAGESLSPQILSKLLTNSKLREPTVSNVVSSVAKIKKIRLIMKKLSQEFTKNPPNNEEGVILDGRDTGTIVAPNADFKFLLTADAKVRAKRRWLDFKEKGKDISFETVLKDVNARDETDDKNPLIPKPTKNTIIIDSSNLDRKQVFDLVLSHIK